MRRPSYAAIVAHLALAVALSGGAVAAVTINGASIKTGTISGKSVKDGSLTGADLKKHSIALDRLSKSLPLQYWSRSASDARYLPVGGTAASALTATSATTATTATTATNATTAMSASTATTAANAVRLGGQPATAYGTTVNTRVHLEQTAGGFSSPLYTNGGVVVAANYCGAAGLGFTVTSTDTDAIGWVSLNAGASSLLINGSNVGVTQGAPQAMTLHLVRGTGAAQVVTDIGGWAAINAGGCDYVTEVTTYTG